MTDEQTEHLHRYFSEEPAWRRQLGQLKKKYLAGYTAGVVSLRDATKAECDAAERLLGRQFYTTAAAVFPVGVRTVFM